MPCHYLNQCWNVVDWTLRHRLQWNLNRNSHIFFLENASENIVRKILAILLNRNVINSWPLQSIPYSLFFINCSRHFLNTVRQKQNGRHFGDDIFKCIFLAENVWISIDTCISLKFICKCQINNISALDQIMAWHRPGDKPLFEPVLVSLLMYICADELKSRVQLL